jgi:THO complex subunit 4
MDDVDEDRGSRRGARRGGGLTRDRERERRSDTTKPPPENIDRYIPRERDSRPTSQRGGRRPGERRERAAREPREGGDGHRMVGGRPRKTAEELDAEMDDYWGGANNGDAAGGNNNTAPAAQTTNNGDADVDMIE